MVEGFEITFPPGTAPAAVDGIVSEVTALGDDVAGAGARTLKGPLADTILAWVQIASPSVGIVSAVVGVVAKVVDLIRGQGVSGTTITLPGGAILEVDHASAEDVERLVRAVAGNQ